ncbi:MFS transporter [Streptomyces sp. AcH 505]|uniref:MFS transporter n=1 Tax=Streptomyces sp. AcH 505 TaxID=352211 RepID=UPI0005A8E66B
MGKRYALWGYVAGAAAARTGDEMSGPALLLAGLAVTGSASAASSLLAGLMISAAIGGPVFGVVLDRSPRPGRLLARALIGYAAMLLVVLAALGHGPVAGTALIAVCAGLLGPALSGGWTSQLPGVVARESLPRANALDAMTFNLASLAGPALAGIVAGLAGASAGVIVAVALICLALPSALALPPARTPAQDRPATSVATDLAAGLRAITGNRPLIRATATSVVSCAGQGMVIACTPLIGQHSLGSADRGALLLSLTAASALAANAVLARHPRLLRPDTVIWCSTLVLAAAFLLAATGRPALLVTAMLIAGIGEGPQLTALFAVRHREAPSRLRGQVFTTGASLKITGFAIGAATAGPLAARSLPGALLAAAALQLLAALCATCYHPTRRRASGRGPDGPAA